MELEEITSLEATTGAAIRLSHGQQKMVALGLQPALIDEQIAAAMCGMSRKRFSAECPLPGARIGKSRFWPRTEIEAWASAYWAMHSGHANNAPCHQSLDLNNWAGLLPELPLADGAEPKAKKYETTH